VLRHHPDKKKSTADSSDKKLSDEDLFACITIANDILSNKEKRQAYDSVDPLFDESIPSVNANSRSNFIDVFGPVFERNVRLVLEVFTVEQSLQWSPHYNYGLIFFIPADGR